MYLLLLLVLWLFFVVQVSTLLYRVMGKHNKSKNKQPYSDNNAVNKQWSLHLINIITAPALFWEHPHHKNKHPRESKHLHKKAKGKQFEKQGSRNKGKIKWLVFV